MFNFILCITHSKSCWKETAQDFILTDGLTNGFFSQISQSSSFISTFLVQRPSVKTDQMEMPFTFFHNSDKEDFTIFGIYVC